MYILSKNVTIAKAFIVAVAVLKAESNQLNTNQLIQASKKTIKYYKYNRLNVIHKSGILTRIISAYYWRQYL